MLKCPVPTCSHKADPVLPGKSAASAGGFTLLEVLLAVMIVGLIAGVALYSRGVTLRAEQKAERLDQARHIMRELVTLDRAGASSALRESSLPPDWRLTTQTVITPTRDVSAERAPIVWRLWRLEHPSSDTVLEIVFEPAPELPRQPAISGGVVDE